METTPSTTSVQYSHPDQPVRHSYPLAVAEDGLGTALSLCMKSLPCIAVRLGVLCVFGFGMIIWFAICGGLAALFSKGGGEGGVVLFLLAVGIPAAVYAWLRHYVLYMLKLGHVAVLTQLITVGQVPDGVSQIQYGKEMITRRFAEANVLFVVDSLVAGVVRAFNGTLDWVASLIPIPGLDGMVKVVERIIQNATTYIDETIFSYNIARGDDNIWRSSADGLVYYGQNVKSILKTAVFGLLLEYALTFIVFLAALIPAGVVGYVLPGTVASFAWVFALLIAAMVRSAVLNPFFLVMVALTFHVNARGQAIDPGMAEKLSLASDKFRELSEKARTWVKGKPQPQAIS